MKKTLIALAVLAVSGAAFAQSTATISGTISVGILDTGAAGDAAQVSSLGGGANAININTVEDLGGGMRAGFSGQIRFSAASGDRTSAGNGNALFHEANAYLTNSMGTLRIGKIAEASQCGFDPWGCTGGAAMAAGAGINGDGRGLIGARAIQNAVSLSTPVINGFSATYLTSVSPATGAQSAASGTNPGQLVGRINERTNLSLNYAKGPLSAQIISITGDMNTNGDWTSHRPAASNNSLIAVADTDSKQQGVAVSYNFGVARLNVANAVTKTAAGVTAFDITTISGSMPMGATTLLAGYSKNSAPGVASNLDTKIAVGVNYALSKRTTIGADVFKADQVGVSIAGTATPGNAGTGFTLRARHTF
ncbi:MAG: porin [Limnohabitans sp.]|uniref:porin n=1 Tax=Limnohabitans sp. TaxID=1907725 RepID=UPI00391BF2CF